MKDSLVEKADLHQEEEGEEEQLPPFSRAGPQRLTRRGRNGSHHQQADGETGAGHRQRGHPLQADLDENLVASPQEGGEQRETGGAGPYAFGAVPGRNRRSAQSTMVAVRT